VNFDEEEFQEFLEIFQEESLERLVSVSNALQVLTDAPTDPKPAQLEEIDRELHTVKGSARLLGFSELGKLVHTIEGLARVYRERPTNSCLDLLIEGCDRLSALVEEAATDGKDHTDTALVARVEAATQGAPPSTPPPTPAPAKAMPAAVPFPEAPEYETRSAKRPTANLEAASATARIRVEDETVRVKASRLALLDEVVAELSLAKQRLEQHGERLRDLTRSVDDGLQNPAALSQTLHRMVQDYRSDTLQIRTTTQTLERLAVDVRLRPVAYLFDQVPREIRDLARVLGKEVRVKIRGEDTEMDRVILSALKSPLTHLLRNVVDHGIEVPSQRRQAGKPSQGLLELSAGQEGNLVVIRIVDDGRGIDPDVLRKVAVERGVLESRAARELSDEDAVGLIFTPGLSTRKAASEISGRGVGMDAVRSTVERLGGDVRVRSTLGEGTSILIRLPLTLLISRVTLVRSGGQQFAIPTESVEESLRLAPSKVATFGDRPSVLLRESTIPLLRLAHLLGHSVLPDPNFLRVLVVHHAGERLALVLDELLEERSVVVKPLGWPLELLSWISGAITLPDGELALQVHMPEIFAHHRSGVTTAQPARLPDAGRSILIVDDSMVSRQLMSRAVSSLGFDPLLAVDGVEAWGILERVVPQIVVTDVDMPRLDGLGLCRRIRRSKRLSGIPIIIFSNRGAIQDRQAGLEAGADAYISKAEFNRNSFRDVIERML
jgi:two-component system, chemotaxis family, sensor kinase CheA